MKMFLTLNKLKIKPQSLHIKIKKLGLSYLEQVTN